MVYHLIPHLLYLEGKLFSKQAMPMTPDDKGNTLEFWITSYLIFFSPDNDSSDAEIKCSNL